MKPYKKLIIDHPELFNNENTPFHVITNEKIILEWQWRSNSKGKDKGANKDGDFVGVAYEDKYIILLRDLIQFPSGRFGAYLRILSTAALEGGYAIVLLPVFQNKIVLQHQFRHPTRQWHWEVVRGFGEPNISAEENARKELEEEIGGEASKLIPLGLYHSNTGMEAGSVHLFYAELSSIGEANLNEGIQSYKLIEVDELERMIRDEEITDGFTIAAYTRAKLKKII